MGTWGLGDLREVALRGFPPLSKLRKKGTWGLGDWGTGGTFGNTDNLSPRLPLSLSPRHPVTLSPCLPISRAPRHLICIVLLCNSYEIDRAREKNFKSKVNHS